MLHILLQPCYKDKLTIYVNEMNMTSLTTITPVCTVYLDLRYLAAPLSRPARELWKLEHYIRWYNDDLEIPNKIEYYYVLECTVESWADTKHTSVILHCSLLSERFLMTSASVTFFCYPAPTTGTHTTTPTAAPTGALLTSEGLQTSAMKLVDAAFIEQYPCVLSRLGK